MVLNRDVLQTEGCAKRGKNPFGTAFCMFLKSAFTKYRISKIVCVPVKNVDKILIVKSLIKKSYSR